MLRASLLTRLGLLTGTCVALPTLFACLEHPLKRVQYDQAQEVEEGVSIEINKDVDILFVIDNSGSMGEEQANVSAQFDTFISVLEAEDVDANYRIGITTTDDGSPAPGCTSPEKGNLVLSSCRSRLGDFEFVGQTTINREEACTDFCPEALAGLEVTPTTTFEDPEPRKRPWLERIEGKTNLPEGVSTTEAFQCFGPQGINGCGFESHLESMFKAFVRFDDAEEDEFGFVRSTAILSVVFVTDEADCSYNNAYSSVFTNDGNKVFWSIPDRPTSAICWNAGVECSGAGPVYDECHPQNYNVDGEVVSEAQAADDAVLRPISRYVNLLQQIEDQKKMANPSQEVFVAAIDGVPTNYPDGGEIVYQDVDGGTANDPDYQINFGIGPGCQSSVGEAVPSVRLKAFAEAFQIGDERNLFSVCSENYGPALEAIANTIKDQIRPACMQACVADTDLASEALDPSCILEQQTPQPDGSVVKSVIPECEEGGAVPEGEDVCYIALVDPGNLTPTPDDQLSQDCIDLGWNLEFDVRRRDGASAAGGTSVSATCELSQQPSEDCPNLPN